ncbi:hypothetical protein PWT90_10358 [Aphanocladium album]|nr:hypothetical protein PWT90_10358 [Aphanocladium album]
MSRSTTGQNGRQFDNATSGITSSTKYENIQPLSEPQQPRSPAPEIFFVAVVCAAQFLTQAGLALSIAPQAVIAHYSLTVGTFILVAGRLGDVFGHKRFLVGGFAWFGVWSVLAGCAVYSGPVFFAFCRVMQSMGPAFIRGDPWAGPVWRHGTIWIRRRGGVSTLLAQKAWWPWEYWIMCVACLLLAALSIFAVPATAKDDTSEPETVDLVGSVAGVSALILFNFAWNQGPVVGWT